MWVMPNTENFWKEIKNEIDDNDRRRVERVCDMLGTIVGDGSAAIGQEMLDEDPKPNDD